MCNCLDSVNQIYREHTGDENASIVYISFRDSKCLPRIEAYHRFKKKDGTLSNRIVTEMIVPIYCPFCGKKYKE